MIDLSLLGQGQPGIIVKLQARYLGGGDRNRFSVRGLARILAQTFGELRDAVFAKVAQRAIRLAGLKAFKHLHRLSLAEHTASKTGVLTARVTSDVEALMSMMTGASIRIASAKATPYAAKLTVGSGSRAMIAARKGPSVAIMIHVAAKGAQKRAMARCVWRKGNRVEVVRRPVRRPE